MTNFGATPDDASDETAGIQAALDQHPNGNWIVYLPPWKYIVTDTLEWPAGKSSGVAHKRTILQGAGEQLSALHLPANSKGLRKASPKHRERRERAWVYLSK